jgi:DNA polymerase-3 subunit beta
MRIQTSQTALERGLSIVSRAVAARHSLDQLRHVHLAADDDGVRLTATDTEIALIVQIEAAVDEPGSITIPHRFINDLVSALDAADLIIDVADGSLVTQIRASDANESSIHGMSASSYPNIPGVGEGDWIKIVASDLREALRHVVFAAATDDGRPVLTGVHFRFDGDTMTLAAADGFRLAVYDMNVASELSETLELTVPARALSELERLLSDEDSSVEMYIHHDRSYVRFHLRSVQMTAQLIQGNYPSYNQLIPSEYQTRAVLPGSALQQKVRSAAVFARESSGIIRLLFNRENNGNGAGAGEITLTARAEELGNHRGRVDAAIEGSDSRIAYNVRYLQEVLQVASGPASEIAMETSGPSNPGVFRVVGRDNYVHVLMPMFVQWEDS